MLRVIFSFLLAIFPISSAIQQPAKNFSPEVLKKYVGRFEVETGIIPISTLDVTLEGNELWIKPSLVKRRRLAHHSGATFRDEIDGRQFRFQKDADGKIVSVSFEYEGGTYTAPRVVLPPPSLKGNTTFRLKGHPDASVVVLSGTFNFWHQSEILFGREGDEWICRIDLEPGKHAYKFIVDGNWLLDPENPNTEEDDYGVRNSVILVTAEKERTKPGDVH